MARPKKPTQKQDIATIERAYELLHQHGLSVGYNETEWIYAGEWIGQEPRETFHEYGLGDVLTKVFGEEAKRA